MDKEALYNKMREKGLTITRLAADLGISRSTFYRKCRGESDFTRAELQRIIEILALIGAVVTFILTEDMRLPMVLIDKWTPLMLVLLAIAWVIDFRLARYRSKVLAEEEQEIREEAARVSAGA